MPDKNDPNKSQTTSTSSSGSSQQTNGGSNTTRETTYPAQMGLLAMKDHTVVTEEK